MHVAYVMRMCACARACASAHAHAHAVHPAVVAPHLSLAALRPLPPPPEPSPTPANRAQNPWPPLYVVHPQEEFPDAYWSAIEALSAGRPVPLPRPHPKFSVQDAARIAAEGPRFSDVVLQHAEVAAVQQTDGGDAAGGGAPAAAAHVYK
eukprot:365853-Chlamydomonas_euryale.AAC.7